MIPIKRTGLSTISNPVAIQRVRVRLSRMGPAALMTHLHQIECIRAGLKKSAWPLALSGAKSPKPKVSFGPAISMGYESQCEFFDVELLSRLDMKKGPGSLQEHLPAGYKVLSIKSIPRFFPSLDAVLNCGEYEIQSSLLEGSQLKWEEFWNKQEFFITKKKKDREVIIDARPLVKSWKSEGNRLQLMVRFGPGRTIKPEKIVQAVLNLNEEQIILGTESDLLKVLRVNLYFEKQNGDLVEP